MRRLLAAIAIALPVMAEEAPKGVLQKMNLKGGVGELVFSADGKILAAGGFNKTIALYDVPTGKLLRIIEGHTGRVTCLSFSPDGKLLASGSDDGSIRFWDPATGKDAGVMEGVHSHGSHGHGTTTLGFFPDGKSIFSTGYDPTVHTWSVENHSEIHDFNGHSDCCFAALSADGKLLATGSQDGSSQVWDAATGDSLFPLEPDPPIGGAFHHLTVPCFTPDGKRLFAGGGDGLVRVWEIPGGKPIRSWQAHTGFVGAAEVSPDGGLLATGGMHPEGGLGRPDNSWDNAIRLWDTSTFEKLLELNGHGMSVPHIRFSPDGTLMATGSWDGSIVLWDLGELDLSGKKAAALSADELWKRLGEEASPRSWSAVRGLAASPDKAADLAGRIEPAKHDPEFTKRVEKLVADLDADAYDVREKAEAELIELGPAASVGVSKALESTKSAEVRMRARHILEGHATWTPASEEGRRWARLVEALEKSGDKGRPALEKLGAGAPDAILTALARAALSRSKAK